MTDKQDEIGILKTLWQRGSDGRWAISDMKGIALKPKAGFGPDFFAFESQMELMTSRPPPNMHDMFASFGPTDYLMKQSILPVIAWPNGAGLIKCVGTAFVVSCTGYVVTASHVLNDPRESGYATIRKDPEGADLIDGVHMGVLMPISPATGQRGYYFLPFQKAWYWGQWLQSPLFHERERFEGVTDVAVCKLPDQPTNTPYQPLNLSLNPFSVGEAAYAIGYAEMNDIPVEYVDGIMRVSLSVPDLYVSIGEVMNLFPRNHVSREVPTPGPSFDFRARIPGRMSGAPIFGAKGSIVRGVVSRSFTDEKHAYGCMMWPAMNLPLRGVGTLKALMESGNDGIAVVHGQGL